jgi:trehalose/maltose hydrolase-like predicted phosphorylase
MEVLGSDGRRALFSQGGSGDPDRDRPFLGEPRRARRRHHIRQVIGPDEYHETVDDNAYTNAMAQWNLEGAERTARLLAERWLAKWRALSRRLGLDAEEPRGWLRVERDLYTGFNKQAGLFEQFQGDFELEEIELAAFAQRTAPIDVLLGRERVRRSKIIKQPDVVVLVHLLWDGLPAGPKGEF